MTKNNAVEIGETIKKMRIDKGYESRSSFVESRTLKNKITQEGLRKIEAGERVPKIDTLRRLTKALGASSRVVKQLERLALEKHVERATRRAGNVDVKFSIEGKSVEVTTLPTKKRTEDFVRRTVDDLIEIGNRLGITDGQDEKYFRQHARNILLRNLAA
jgi:transcriptional regulator with XRE-family HTH domain